MKRLRPATKVWLALGAVVAAAQFVSAFLVHVTVRAEPTRSGWVVPPPKTSMQTFGVSEVIVSIVSLAAVVVVCSVLSRRAGSAAHGAGLCLLVACVSVPRRRPMATIGASSARPPVEPLKGAAPESISSPMDRRS